MKYYPAFLNLKGKRCFVIGGGKVAERKIKTLLSSGADLAVISPSLTSNIKRLIKRQKIRFIENRFKSPNLKNAFLVIGATNDKKTNREVFEYCRKNNILVNIVDSPKISDFISPAILKRKDLIVAISTSGLNPALAKRVRQDLEKFFKKRRYESLL